MANSAARTDPLSNNLILIGPPGSGKSTVGVLLAKQLALGFVDTDLLIQSRTGVTLQRTVDEHGYVRLREIEQDVVLDLRVDDHVVATGGSVVYGEAGMTHLSRLGTLIFLDVDEPTMRRRIGRAAARGLAKPADQTIGQMYAERRPMYLRHADRVVSAHQEAQRVVDLIAQQATGGRVGPPPWAAHRDGVN